MNPKDRMETGGGSVLSGLYSKPVMRGRVPEMSRRYTTDIDLPVAVSQPQPVMRGRRPRDSGGRDDDSFLRTPKEDEMLRAGKVPAGYSRGKDGKVRPMVQ